MKYEGAIYRPPSEARSLILQVTIGCAHNRCSFCTMYREKKFRIRDTKEVCQEIREAALTYGDRIEKFFLADGDALVIKTDQMLQILEQIRTSFPAQKRITSYGTASDILRKSGEELRVLRAAGLHMVYLGAESGDEKVLKEVGKNTTREELIRAGQSLKEAGILSSVTLISGLGGKERFEEHAIQSADLISEMNPDYVGFLTLLLDPKAPISQQIRSGEKTLLSPEEVVEEMELFLSHVDSEGTVFRANHASNYLLLKGELNRDIPRMLSELRFARENHQFRKENWRAF